MVLSTAEHYNYFRDYDASIGRYLQGDPIALAGGFNLYSYVGSGPLTAIDLYGLCESIMEAKLGDWYDDGNEVVEIGSATLRVPVYEWEVEIKKRIKVCSTLKGFNKWRARLLKSVTFQKKDKYVRTCTTCNCDGVKRCGDWINTGPGDAREKTSFPWPKIDFLGFFPVDSQPCVQFAMPPTGR